MPETEIMANMSSHPLWNDNILVSFTIAIDTITLLLNILPVYTVVRQKRLFPYAIDETILAFSLTEIVTVLITLPSGLVSHYTQGWRGGKALCLIYQAVVIWSEVMTMCIVTTMGTERVKCVKRLGNGDLTFKRHDLKNVRIRLAVIFLFSTFVALFPVIGIAPTGYSSSSQSCHSVLVSHVTSSNQYSFFVIFLMVGYFNVVICAVIFSSIIAQLVHLKRGHKPTPTSLDTASELDRIEIKCQTQEVISSTVMVVVMAMLFYFTTVPTLVLVTMEKVVQSSIKPEVVLYSILGTSCSGLLTPLIYPSISRRYRSQYKRLLCRVSKGIFGCPVLYEDVIPEMLPNAERLGMHESESTNDAVPTDDITTQAVTFTKTYCQNETYTDFPEEGDNAHIKNSNGNMHPCSVVVNGSYVNTVGRSHGQGEDDILEETTYITHDSNDEDNDVCISGSRLSLVSSGSD